MPDLITPPQPTDRKHGNCPFQGTIIPLQEQGLGTSPTVTPVALSAPCMGEKCQLWDSTFERCSLVTFPILSANLESLIPPKGQAHPTEKEQADFRETRMQVMRKFDKLADRLLDHFGEKPAKSQKPTKAPTEP